eukprot:gene19708-25633_t
MSSTYDMVKSAISALLIPSETTNANKWLTDFERQFIAWEIAEKLLNEPSNTTFRFFESLIKSIVEHLIKLSEEKPLDTRVCRYLSLALSALSLQINQEGVVSQILSWLNAIINSAPKVILNLLVVLPEEAYNDKIDVDGTFLQLSGQWPVYSIDEKDGCIGDVLWVSKISYPDQFQLWVKEAMQSLSVMALEESVKLNLFDSLTTLSDKKSFITLIDDYEWKCSKSKPSALT